MTESGYILSFISVTLKGPYDSSCETVLGQYCSHFILFPSFKLVTITIDTGLSCQIRRQKSTNVLFIGPKREKEEVNLNY